jgi:hypothetical protein
MLGLGGIMGIHRGTERPFLYDSYRPTNRCDLDKTIIEQEPAAIAGLSY